MDGFRREIIAFLDLLSDEEIFILYLLIREMAMK